MFTMQWAKIFGSRKVVVFDISEERLELAKRLGADAVINTTKENYMQEAWHLPGKRDMLCVRDGRTDPDYAYGI